MTGRPGRGPGARRKMRATAERRRDEILVAATKVFVRRGYHAASVADVIRTAGISRGTFHLYFESKHAVFAALVDRMLDLFLETVRAEVPPMPDLATARRVLRENYRSLLHVLHEHRDLLRLFLEDAAGADRAFARRIADHRVKWQDRVRDRILAMRDRGLVRMEIDFDVAAWAVVGTVEMVARAYVLRDPLADLDRLADSLVDQDLRGISGDVASAPIPAEAPAESTVTRSPGVSRSGP